MKWRHSAVYMVIFLLVAGYFYYFEVVQRERKQAEEVRAMKIFHFKADGIRALEIFSKDKKTVKLAKETAWRIVEPIEAGVDQAALEGFISTLETLRAERELADAPETDLDTYGLDKPPLKIRLQENGRWVELVMGDKSPVGDGYYARTAEKPGVFLVSEGVRGILNKGLDELRRRDLFDFTPDQVVGVEVSRQGNSVVRLDLQDGNWSSPDQPGLKVKASKVENLLEQMQWLRVEEFLEDEPKNFEAHGLEPADAEVKLRFKEGSTADLLLAKKTEGKALVAACSSQLPAVVKVGASFLDELPGSLQDFEDRSVFSFKNDEIKQMKWQTGQTEVQAVRLAENKWGWKEGPGEKAREIKNSWRVGSILYDLEAMEYLKKVDPAPEVPAKPHGRLELWTAEGRLGSLIWNRSSKDGSREELIWLEQDGNVRAVQIEGEKVRKLEEDLNRVAEPGSVKSSPVSTGKSG